MIHDVPSHYRLSPNVPWQRDRQLLMHGIGFERGDPSSLQDKQHRLVDSTMRPDEVRYIKAAIFVVGDGLPVRIGLTPMHDLDMYKDIQLDVAKIRNAARALAREHAMQPQQRRQFTFQLLCEYVKQIADDHMSEIATMVADGWSLDKQHGSLRPDIMPVSERTRRREIREEISAILTRVETLLLATRYRVPEDLDAGEAALDRRDELACELTRFERPYGFKPQIDGAEMVREQLRTRREPIEKA